VEDEEVEAEGGEGAGAPGDACAASGEVGGVGVAASSASAGSSSRMVGNRAPVRPTPLVRLLLADRRLPAVPRLCEPSSRVISAPFGELRVEPTPHDTTDPVVVGDSHVSGTFRAR